MDTFLYGVEIEAESRDQANARLNDLLRHEEGFTGWALARVNPWPEILDRDDDE